MKLTSKIFKLANLIKKVEKIDREEFEPLPSTGIILINNGARTKSDGIRIMSNPEISEMFTEMELTIDQMVDRLLFLKRNVEKKYRDDDRLKQIEIEKKQAEKELQKEKKIKKHLVSKVVG